MSKEVITIPQPNVQVSTILEQEQPISTIARGVQQTGGGSSYDDTELRRLIATKQDKQEGKGLSTNDYTTEDKNKLSNLHNYDDTSIVNSLNDKVDKVANKGLSSNDYTNEDRQKLSSLSNYDDTEIRNSLSNKVDKVNNKGLSTNDYTTEEKNKLAGLSNYDDSSLASRVSTIEGKIPSQATSSNQLADKNFVNSSIATSTAYFRGTYNSLADLQAYSGEKTVNDYAFVIDTDSAGNTLYKKYKYSGTEWIFEYTLNNSSFTSNQWATINSGITSNDKTNYDGYATSKQDKIDSTHKLDYSLIDNTPTIPTIPTNISSFNNDSGYVTSSHHDSTKQDKIDSNNKLDYSLLSGIPTNVSSFNNDSGYITSSYHDSSKQDTINANNKLDYDYLSNTPTIPTLPSNIVTGSGTAYTIWVGSSTAYNNITTKDANTLYFITG